MEKIMSKFNVNKEIKSGVVIFSFKCKYCNTNINVEMITKLNKKKIKTCKCPNCNKYNLIGDIYNFDSGKQLNNKLDSRFSMQLYDAYEWSLKFK